MKYSDAIKQKYGKEGRLNDYLSVEGEFLSYKNIKLCGLVAKYGAPLEVGYTEIINERINSLKENFRVAAKKFGYTGKYIYAYASKANYYSEVLATALDTVDALEVTSSYDLDIVEYLFKAKLLTKDIPIICNGFKYDRYLEKIFSLREQGFNLQPVLENEQELNTLLLRKDLSFNVGLRLNLDNDLLSGEMDSERAGSDIDSRFGFFFEDMRRCAEKVRSSEHLTLKIFHFHFGGTIQDLGAYRSLVEDIYRDNYCELKRANPSLEFFDVGGGLPVQYDLGSEFDYQKYADTLVETVVKVSDKAGVSPANIIGECGRYTVNDYGFFCFKIAMTKKTKEKDTFWYFINGSLMNFLPDAWALGQNFIILPLNGWGREAVKVRLGGITCDPDDTYYKHEKDNFIYLPATKDGEDLYIGIFGVGAYQEMISGVGGVHHCLLPEGNELVIYRKDGKLQFDKITPLQAPEKVLKILDYHGMHAIQRYKGN